MFQKRFFVFFAVVMALHLFTLAGVNAGQPGGVVPREDAVVLKLGHANDTENPTHYGLAKYAEEVARLTNRTVIVDEYPNSLLGNEREMVEGCALGTTELSVGLIRTL
jgi:TRAP-type C4-dicarboxylate transport system substrate-binding protein